MTAPSTTPPLDEREAVARTERPGFNFIDLELRCDERADMPEEISPDTLREAAAAIRQLRRERHELEAEDTRLRTEIKALQTQRDAAKNEVTELCRRVDQMNRDWAAEGIEWLRSSDIDRLQGAEARAITAEAERDAAIARAEEAERATDQVRTAMIAKHKEAWRQINDLTAKLAQAEGEIATMRTALQTIAEEHDAGRHDGLPEACPAHEAEVMWAVARAALTNPEHPHGD